MPCQSQPYSETNTIAGILMCNNDFILGLVIYHIVMNVKINFNQTDIKGSCYHYDAYDIFCLVPFS